MHNTSQSRSFLPQEPNIEFLLSSKVLVRFEVKTLIILHTVPLDFLSLEGKSKMLLIELHFLSDKLIYIFIYGKCVVVHCVVIPTIQ